jgi:hypothetical protein
MVVFHWFGSALELRAGLDRGKVFAFTTMARALALGTGQKRRRLNQLSKTDDHLSDNQ